jgi:hypothetical protein
MERKKYKLIVPPLSYSELDDRLTHAIDDAFELELELRLPRFMRHLRHILPTVLRNDPDPWDWSPNDERWRVDDWARHAATAGARAAWSSGELPSMPPTKDPARARCWSTASTHAYMTTAQHLQGKT